MEFYSQTKLMDLMENSEVGFRESKKTAFLLQFQCWSMEFFQVHFTSLIIFPPDSLQKNFQTSGEDYTTTTNNSPQCCATLPPSSQSINLSLTPNQKSNLHECLPKFEDFLRVHLKYFNEQQLSDILRKWTQLKQLFHDYLHERTELEWSIKSTKRLFSYFEYYDFHLSQTQQMFTNYLVFRYQ